jgi:hypothetical protein
MTRFKHDQYAKQYLEALLEKIGKVEVSHEISAEPLQADLYFIPKDVPKKEIKNLGLLGKMASSGACLLEPFRSQPSNVEIMTCMQKLTALHNKLQRKAKQEAKQSEQVEFKSIPEKALPNLWILATSASDRLLDDFKAVQDKSHWCDGVYFLGKGFQTAIVAINKLPCTP